MREWEVNLFISHPKMRMRIKKLFIWCSQLTFLENGLQMCQYQLLMEGESRKM
jgi:hypothetical protein